MQNLATKFENLTIQSDFIFKKVMSRKRICIHLLEELLQIKIADISYFEAEKSLEPDYASRGIRLDIIVADDKNTHYNLEMQVNNIKNPDTKHYVLPKRTRYYQALMDIDLLQKGQEYDLLPPTYIIFICVFDFFAKGNYVTRQIDDEISYLKLDTKVRREFMLLEARLLDERREGKAEGEAKEKLATAKRLLSMGLSVQDVAKGTSLSVEQVEKIKAEQA